MKIKCLHGYFIFTETEVGQLSRFMNIYGLSIVKSNDHFTFEFLKDAPNYSIKGKEYLGVEATVTFEGNPWDVMRANNLVYNFNSGLVEMISTVNARIDIFEASNYFVSNGLILSGSITDDGLRVTDYSAHYVYKQFKYSEVTYV